MTVLNSLMCFFHKKPSVMSIAIFLLVQALVLSSNLMMTLFEKMLYSRQSFPNITFDYLVFSKSILLRSSQLKFQATNISNHVENDIFSYQQGVRNDCSTSHIKKMNVTSPISLSLKKQIKGKKQTIFAILFVLADIVTGFLNIHGSLRITNS